ncbi:MAG TPA: DsbA family protein [Acidimicrobiales bacterium]|nr:DsbA family protein [Acidimicrobiales bacterium]
MPSIEVFADVWCPFTHFGLQRFVHHRAELGPEVTLVVRAWPLELVNGRPLDADFVAEEIADIRAQVAPDLFAGFDPARFPRTTLPALGLTAAAYRSSPAAGEAMALELRRRLFELGQDVSDPAVLAEVASAHGVEGPGPDARAVVEQEWAAGRDRGVVGSPHFFTPGGDFFCPALDVRRVEGHLCISADPEGFDRFIAGCFAAG